jgi:catechol 2,3-dioxygenase-like lactoylglutathione lyase family enzyme
MHRGRTAAFAAGVLCWTLCGSAAWGQSGETAAGPAVGVRAMIHSVANLEKTVAFYHDGLGLELTGPGASSKKLAAPNALDESLSRFTDTHGAKFRNASFKIPGAAFGLELTEFTGTKRMAVQPHMQDPGAGTLVLMVRDIGKALAGAKANGGTVLSLGGKPGKVGGENSKSLSVFVRDPDGFLLELAHIDPMPATDASASSNVIGARIGLTIANTD